MNAYILKDFVHGKGFIYKIIAGYYTLKTFSGKTGERRANKFLKTVITHSHK